MSMYKYNLKRTYSTQEENFGQVYTYPKKRGNHTSKKRKSKAKTFLAVFLWVVALSFSTAVNYQNYLRPAYLNRINNRSLDLNNVDKYITPTSDYAKNLNFMGENMLAGVPEKGKARIILIKSTGTNELLKAKIENILAEYPKLKGGVFIYDYTTGKSVEINADETFSAASIIKVPVLLDLFYLSKKREDGGFESIDLNKKIVFEETHRTEGSGDMQYGQSGTEHSIDNLLKVMIRKSDNSATNMLIEEVGGINSINSNLRHWGFSKTHIGDWLPDLTGDNRTTPKEISTMLYNIDNSAFLPQKSSQKIKEYMSKVENRTLIKSQIPNDATLIHKTGDIGKMLGDAGIIYTSDGKKFILTIMVKRPHNDYSAREMIQKIAKETYTMLSKS